MKKRLKIIGIILIILGLVLILLVNIKLTGAVINIKNYLINLDSIVGILVLVVSIIIFTLDTLVESQAEARPDEIKQPRDIEGYVNQHTPDHLKDYKPSLWYKLFRFLGKATNKLVYGKEKIPEGPKLYISTHRNPYLDASLLMAAVDEPIHIFAGESINFTPIRGYFARRFGMIPIKETLSHRTAEEKKEIIKNAGIKGKDFQRVVDNEEKYNSRNVNYVRAMTSMLLQGRSGGIFAEGLTEEKGEKYDDDVKKAYAGYALIAREYKRVTGKDLPIVPVGINNRKVAFGNPFYIDQNGKLSREQLEDTATQKLSRLYKSLKD